MRSQVPDEETFAVRNLTTENGRINTGRLQYGLFILLEKEGKGSLLWGKVLQLRDSRTPASASRRSQEQSSDVSSCPQVAGM